MKKEVLLVKEVYLGIYDRFEKWMKDEYHKESIEVMDKIVEFSKDKNIKIWNWCMEYEENPRETTIPVLPNGKVIVHLYYENL